MSVRRIKRRDPNTGAVREFWQVDIDFQHPDGRRQRIRRVSPVQTRRGAERYERELRQALLDGSFGRREVPKFATFAAEWLDSYVTANNGPGEQRNKRSVMRDHLLPALGTKRLDEITTSNVEHLKAKLRNAGRHPKTVNNIIGILRTCLRCAMDDGLLSALPKIKRLKVPPRDFDFYTPEEAEALVTHAKQGWPRRAIRIALVTGLRQGEERGLKWDDVDFHGRLLHVRRSLSQDGTQARPPKSNRTRRVSLSDGAMQALKSQRADSMMKSPWVFCDKDGGPLTRAKFEHQLIVACRRAGLRKLRWHDLRHSFASHLTMAGVPLKVVQELLGHSTIGMTERYAHLAPDNHREAVAVLDRAPSRQHGGNASESSG